MPEDEDPKPVDKKRLSRRDFLKIAAATGAKVAANPLIGPATKMTAAGAAVAGAMIAESRRQSESVMKEEEKHIQPETRVLREMLQYKPLATPKAITVRYSDQSQTAFYRDVKTGDGIPRALGDISEDFYVNLEDERELADRKMKNSPHLNTNIPISQDDVILMLNQDMREKKQRRINVNGKMVDVFVDSINITANPLVLQEFIDTRPELVEAEENLINGARDVLVERLEMSLENPEAHILAPQLVRADIDNPENNLTVSTRNHDLVVSAWPDERRVVDVNWMGTEWHIGNETYDFYLQSGETPNFRSSILGLKLDIEDEPYPELEALTQEYLGKMNEEITNGLSMRIAERQQI